MQKPAPVDHPIHPLIRDRWSPRAFLDRPVEKEKLLSLLEAARWAPSSYNEQPWVFFVATRDEPEEYDRLLKCLVEFNQSWAASAPVLMLSVAAKRFARNQKDNRHALHDVGLAAGNLALEAVALGLAIHQMAGFDLDKARDTLGIPESHEPVAAIALGYPREPDDLAGELKERELDARSRKPLSDMAFTGSWGKSAPVLS